MHAVRGTIGYTPVLPKQAEKQASRERVFEARSEAALQAEVDASLEAADLTQEKVDSYRVAILLGLADLEQAKANGDAPSNLSDLADYVFASLIDAGLVK